MVTAPSWCLSCKGLSPCGASDCAHYLKAPLSAVDKALARRELDGRAAYLVRRRKQIEAERARLDVEMVQLEDLKVALASGN